MATLVNAPGTPFHGAHVRLIDGEPDEHGRIPAELVGYEGEAILYVPVLCLIAS